MDHGFAAVSHRAVAQRAGLSLSATTYYFASLDDLVHQCVQHLADDWLAVAGEVVAGLPQRLGSPGETASAILRLVALSPAEGAAVEPAGVEPAGVEPAALLSLYERYLESGRHPRLRPVIARYDEGIDQLLGEVLVRAGLPDSPATARLVLAVVDGALLRALANGDPLASATAPVEQLLRFLTPAPTPPADKRP